MLIGHKLPRMLNVHVPFYDWLELWRMTLKIWLFSVCSCAYFTLRRLDGVTWGEAIVTLGFSLCSRKIAPSLISQDKRGLWNQTCLCLRSSSTCCVIVSKPSQNLSEPRSPHQRHRGGMLVSCCYCNQLSQILSLWTAQTYYLTVLELESLKLSLWS